jgi:hypothetical protein
MRRTSTLAVLAILAIGLSACGASAATQTSIVFGVGGGNMVPYSVTIEPSGAVHPHGSARVKHRQISTATVRRLRQEIQDAHLRSRECSGTLPDVGADYIRVSGRTVTVHGDCEPRFHRVWNDLAQAVGLRY